MRTHRITRKDFYIFGTYRLNVWKKKKIFPLRYNVAHNKHEPE